MKLLTDDTLFYMRDSDFSHFMHLGDFDLEDAMAMLDVTLTKGDIGIFFIHEVLELDLQPCAWRWGETGEWVVW